MLNCALLLQCQLECKIFSVLSKYFLIVVLWLIFSLKKVDKTVKAHFGYLIYAIVKKLVKYMWEKMW